MEPTLRIFLTAEWRELAMLNYAVDPRLLHSFVPSGTELDIWEGRCFLSLVGFRFIKTKVRGMAIPGHQNFEEVNLRFYVRRRATDGWRRGVVFIREIVPQRAIAVVARILYNEKYIALPMFHEISRREDGLSVEYGWTLRGRSNKLTVAVRGEAAVPAEGSQPHFITEHFWGYSAQPDSSCMEYRVEHPPWAVWTATGAHFEGDVAELYGQDFAVVLQREPDSALLAVGSGVTVYQGRRI
jgi:uncharacterized protein YqjF (DUF2071 family)